MSTLDHFFWDDKFREAVEDAGVLHHPSNTSDHSPIYCHFHLNVMSAEETTARAKPIMKPNWAKSSDMEKSDYRNLLTTYLSAINVPDQVSSCQDVHCKNPEHIAATDSLVIAVLEAVDNAACNTLSCVKSRSAGRNNKPIISGWSSFIKPFKEKSLFWHNVWQSAGRPLNCELHRVMKHSRNIYHYNLRKCKKQEQAIRRNRLLDACMNGDRDLFAELKNCRKSSPTIPSSMDGKFINIEEHFKSTYNDLYNCIDDKEDLTTVNNEVNCCINQFHLNDVKKVTPAIVKEATSRLKNGKSDPVFLFSSDCFSNAPNILFSHLSIILQSFLIHGHVSTFLLLATLVPIIKDKLGSTTTSKNYRSIAISSLVLKILDWVTLLLFGTSLGLDDLQYAYQSKASTTMCTWLVMETIGYFIHNGSEVFTCQTDMSKAFDMVRHSL